MPSAIKYCLFVPGGPSKINHCLFYPNWPSAIKHCLFVPGGPSDRALKQICYDDRRSALNKGVSDQVRASPEPNLFLQHQSALIYHNIFMKIID